MRDAIRALAALKAIIMLLWPVTAWAAGASLGQTFGAITLSDWLVLLVLSTVSGLVALLNRVRISLEAVAAEAAGQPHQAGDRVRIAWPVFAACHMTGALFVGALAFFGCEAFDLNTYLEAALIALASWSGAKLADRFADVASDRVAALLGQGGGRGA